MASNITIDPENRANIVIGMTDAGMSRLDAETSLDLAIFAANEAWARVSSVAASAEKSVVKDQVVMLATQLLEGACRGFIAQVVGENPQEYAEVGGVH